MRLQFKSFLTENVVREMGKVLIRGMSYALGIFSATVVTRKKNYLVYGVAALRVYLVKTA